MSPKRGAFRTLDLRAFDLRTFDGALCSPPPFLPIEYQSPGTQEVGDGGMIFEGMYLFMSNNALPLAWEAVRVTFGEFLFLRFFRGATPPTLGFELAV